MTNPTKAISFAVAMLGAALVVLAVRTSQHQKAVQAGETQGSGDSTVTEPAGQADKGRQQSASAGKSYSSPRKTVKRRTSHFHDDAEAEGTAGETDTSSVISREMLYQQVAGRGLGAYLAAAYPGARVLILSEPNLNDQAAPREHPLIVGLKEEIAGKLPVVAEVRASIPVDKQNAFAAEMPVGANAGGLMMPPLEYWYTAEVFDGLLSDYAGQYDLVATVIGLPQDVGASAVLSGTSHPRVALLNGSIYDLKAALTPDRVVAAITYNPKAVYDDKPVPMDLDEAFAKRFLLVTPETVQQQSRDYPDIFRTDN
jgi:hypothetical protein